MDDHAAIAPEKLSYRFVILAAVWASYLIVYLSRLSVGPLAPFLKESFDLSAAQVGSLTSATAVTYAPSMIVAGLIVDRLGVKRVLVTGTVVAGLCVGLMFLAPSYPVLLLLLALSGFGCGCIYPSAVKALVAWFPVRERATAIGINQSAINVSGIAGAAILPTVAMSWGWQYGFLLVGLLALAVGAVAFALYREPRAARGLGLADEPCDEECEQLEVMAEAADVGDAVPGHSHWHGVRSLFRIRDIWLLAAGGLSLGVVEFSALAYMVLYLHEGLGFTVVAAGGMLAVCEAAGAFGKPIVGLISDRVFRGRRKPMLMILALGSLAVCVALSVFTYDLSGATMWAALLVFGVAAIGWAGLYATVAGEIGGAHRAGLAAGFCSAMTNIGIMVGPPLFGYLIDRSGSYRPSFILMAAVSAVAVVSWTLVREPHAARQAEASSVPVAAAP